MQAFSDKHEAAAMTSPRTKRGESRTRVVNGNEEPFGLNRVTRLRRAGVPVTVAASNGVPKKLHKGRRAA